MVLQCGNPWLQLPALTLKQSRWVGIMGHCPALPMPPQIGLSVALLPAIVACDAPRGCQAEPRWPYVATVFAWASQKRSLGDLPKLSRDEAAGGEPRDNVLRGWWAHRKM